MDKCCFGCKWLSERLDGAGGGIFLCDKRPGLVVGDWGHWRTGGVKPTGSDDCYEKREAQS